MKKSIVIVPAIFLLFGCSTSPVAVCSPDDTACLEAALAATAATAAAPAPDRSAARGDDRGWEPRSLDRPPMFK